MPLHPQVRGMLDNLAAAGMPPLHSLPVDQCRIALRQLMTSMPPSAATIAKVQDQIIEGPGVRVPLRIYTPAGEGPFPIVLFLHGGGWVIGDIEAYDTTCRELCGGSESVVISVDYRLAPEHPFPAAVDDAMAALRWTLSNAASLNGDAKKIAVAGDSAGGNLAAVTAIQAQQSLPGAIRAQLLVYPVAAHYNDPSVSMRENADGYLLTRNDMVWFIDHYLGGTGQAANPLFNLRHAKLTPDMPSALVITAEFDPLRDEGEAYAAALKNAGVQVSMTRYDGAIHGFFTFSTALDLGRDAMDQACQWLRTNLSH